LLIYILEYTNAHLIQIGGKNNNKTIYGEIELEFSLVDVDTAVHQGPEQNVGKPEN
jgi:hypothetical protein